MELNALVIHDRPITALSLKKLVLIFDHVYFIDPEENEFLIPSEVASYKYGPHIVKMGAYHIMYNGERYIAQEENLINEFDYAYNHGVLVELNLRTRKFYEKNWLPLHVSFDFDIGNAEILNALSPRVEKSTDFTLAHTGIVHGGMVVPKGAGFYPTPPSPVTFYNEEENNAYRCDHQLYSSIGRINRAIMVSSTENLVPIFLSQNIADAFSHKFQTAKSNQDPKVIRNYKEKTSLELANLSYLLYQLADTMVVDEVLENIPVKELIIARNNTFHELLKFRRQLSKNIDFISAQNFDERFTHEVNEYIQHEIVGPLK